MNIWSMIRKFLSNFFQFHLTRWPKMTFQWPLEDPKVWNLTLKPINYPILLIQLICQLQNIHFSNILTSSLKKLKFHEFKIYVKIVNHHQPIAWPQPSAGIQPSADDQPSADRSRSILIPHRHLQRKPSSVLVRSYDSWQLFS